VKDSGWANAVIAMLSFLFFVILTLVGLLWRWAKEWGSIITEVKHLAESIKQIAVDSNRRLQRLEDNQDTKRRKRRKK